MEGSLMPLLAEGFIAPCAGLRSRWDVRRNSHFSRGVSGLRTEGGRWSALDPELDIAKFPAT